MSAHTLKSRNFARRFIGNGARTILARSFSDRAQINHFHVRTEDKPILKRIVQHNIAVEMYYTSNDLTRDMLRAVVVVVGPYAKAGVHETGNELFLEPGTVLKCALRRLDTVFKQQVEFGQAWNCGMAGLKLHCVRTGGLKMNIDMNENIKLAKDIVGSAVDMRFYLPL